MNKITDIFKILSDETRLRILLLLYEGELCVCQISGILDVPQPKISKNLSKLRDLRIVEDDRQEKFVYYTLSRDNELLMDILKRITKNPESPSLLQSDKDRLVEKETYLNQCSNLNVQ